LKRFTPVSPKTLVPQQSVSEFQSQLIGLKGGGEHRLDRRSPGAGLLSYIAIGLFGIGSYGWKRLRRD
jgi:hypothetical protein